MSDEATCRTCDGRGFVFEQLSPTHRKQVICPACEGAPIRAHQMALLLSGEETLPIEVERHVFRSLHYDQQMFATMRKQLKP